MIFFVVPDDTIFAPLIIGRDFFKKAGIKLVVTKRCYSKDKILSLNHNCPVSFKVRETLEKLGILGSSDNFERKSDALQKEMNEIKNENTDDLIAFDIAEPNKGINNYFYDLCAIDTTSNIDEPFSINESLPSDRRNSFRSAIHDAYYNTELKPSTTDDYCVKLELMSQVPISRRPRRLSHQQRIEVRELVKDLLERNIIRPSNSPYSSAIVPVPKKSGEIRLCVDYRPLNKITERDNHPLPLPDDCIEHLGNKKFFTLLDLKSGFHQIKMHADSIKYTSFVTPDGQYEYVRLPFGLKNGPAAFQRFINNTLRDLINEGLLVVYMDDILIASPDFETHMKTVTEALKRLRSYGLELNLKKCKFAQTELEYLGHHASAKGIRPSDRHIEAIKNYPPPKNFKQLEACNGLFSFFRRFVPNFSKIAYPLLQLLKKNTPFVFTDECMQAFLTLRQKLMEAPVLCIFDPNRETEIHCDASSRGFGGALLQKQDDKKFHPVAYFSKSTAPAEKNLHSYELETLAVVYTLKRFATYLDRRPFKIVTDCDALARTLANENGVSKIFRWALFLESFNYTIVHRPGKSMGHVDALSRIEANVGAISELDIDFQLRVAQSRDPEICRLRSHLETADSDEYELTDEIVYQISPSGKRRLYVPKEMINSVIRWTREKIGHLGVDKCCWEIKKHYWFPLMKTRVHNFIRSCLKCIVYSAPARKNKRNLFNIPKLPVPFDTIHIDHLGPLPSVTSKKKHILVVVDSFTKFTKLYPVVTTNTKESCVAMQNYIDNYSRPRRIISDRGTAFSSNDCQKFCEERNIEHIMNATASPQANGQVERVNRVLTPMMAKMCEKLNHADWSSTLRKVEHTLNNTVHTTTKETPAILLFGAPQRGEVIDELAEYLEERNGITDRNLSEIREEASKNIIKSQEANLNRFLKHNSPANTYEKGEYVAIRHTSTTPGHNKKLDQKYRGPYVIEKVLSHDRYLVRDVDGCQITQMPYNGILEANKLKKWSSDSADLVEDEGPEETLSDSGIETDE